MGFCLAMAGAARALCSRTMARKRCCWYKGTITRRHLPFWASQSSSHLNIASSNPIILKRVHTNSETQASIKELKTKPGSAVSYNLPQKSSSTSIHDRRLQQAWKPISPVTCTSVDRVCWDHLLINPNTGQTDAIAIAVKSRQTVQESMRLLMLVRAYQAHGHMKAMLDPLQLPKSQRWKTPLELDPALYGFTVRDMDRELVLGLGQTPGFVSYQKRSCHTLGSIIETLERAYCGTIGYEYMHIPDLGKRNWLTERIEADQKRSYDSKRKAAILDHLICSTEFESFLAKKWSGTKRFGLEGCETLIPGIRELIERAAYHHGVENITLGMSHRGRLNVLANVLQKPLQRIFKERDGSIPYACNSSMGAAYIGSGDVKYHLGASHDHTTRDGKQVHLTLLANPSHLEAVNPVVVGKTRAKQDLNHDNNRIKYMALLIHGDGSFAGQGSVYETLQLGDLPNYTTGGTIHIVVNNQVAFTTDPEASRSSPYCTDVAKALNAPIFHVNGDDVEGVVHACELASDWRNTFHSDVVVEIVCYRANGHNEGDEPAYTQPRMYKVIKGHLPALQAYEKELINSYQLTKEEIDKMHEKFVSRLEEDFRNSKTYAVANMDCLTGQWSNIKGPNQCSEIRNTGVKHSTLKRVGKAITTLPSHGLNPHTYVKKIYEQRVETIDIEHGIDWATAESLAFGTLLDEGYHVRLSGQDVERGTFNHRHAVVHDQDTRATFCPLKYALDDHKKHMFTISNSSLSEFGVLGFELGYSMENPNTLVCWEAQFGDFANCAQVIFDQFLSSGEAKWLRQNGLVVLLPHGYDGQGPEHSSGRLERFLQMCNDNPFLIPEMDPACLRTQAQECNWQVVNITTPANYFHVLRRQLYRDFRKPLIIMSPKSLLRSCKSNLSEFIDMCGSPEVGEETGFKRLLKDHHHQADLENNVRRLILCSGKVYYELTKERARAEREDVAICRLEQLCPFPYDLVQSELKRFPNAEIVWCQEEPMNMGAFSYIAPRLATAMKVLNHGGFGELKYVGRQPSAATATGYGRVHAKEQQDIVKKALQPTPILMP